MATKKSTPKKTNTKAKTSVARTAGKGFDAGMKSALGLDPKPYNRRQATPASQKKTSTPKSQSKTSTDKPRYTNVDRAATTSGFAVVGDKNVERFAEQGKLMNVVSDRNTGRIVPQLNSARQKYPNATSFDAEGYRKQKASNARGASLNNSASLPKGATGPAKSDRKRFYPVDHLSMPDYTPPKGSVAAKLDTYTGKYVPVFSSGSDKKKK